MKSIEMMPIGRVENAVSEKKDTTGSSFRRS